MLLNHQTPDGVRRARQQSLSLYGYDDGVVGATVEAGLTEIARLARSFLFADAATVNLLPTGRQVVVAATDVAGPGEVPEQESICATLLEQRPVSTIVIPDLARDARFADNPFVTGERAALRGYASAPLIGHERIALGTLCVLSTTPRTLTRDETSLLDQLARAAVKVLDDGRRDRVVRHFPARGVRPPVPAA